MDKGLNASKKVVHKAGEFIGNKIADAVTKSNDDNIEKKRTCWRNNYSTWKKRGNIKEIEKSIIKTEHYKISKLLNYSTLSKLVTKNGLK